MVTPGDGANSSDPFGVRVDYAVPGLADDEVASDPLSQFEQWLREAVTAQVREPNAMSLATSGPDGPSVRLVLAKGVDRTGVRFFTNLESDKARDIAADPRVAVVFSWLPLHRQVRFTGRATLLDRPVVDEYFASRPREARLGAWASPQSRTLASREELVRRVREAQERYFGEVVPTPETWGGYLIRPSKIEFWQGQPSRLHDRIRFDALHTNPGLDTPGDWQSSRLAP